MAGINRNTSDTKRSEQSALVNSFDEDFNNIAFENLKWNPGGSLDREVVPELALVTAVDSADSNVTYVGEATTGSPTSTSVWRIKSIDETSGTVVTWADGNSNFDNEWDERENLSYS